MPPFAAGRRVAGAVAFICKVEQSDGVRVR